MSDAGAGESGTATEASRSALTMSVVTSFQELGDLREAWNRLAAETGAPVYLTCEHCEVWWAHYGAGRSLRILVFRAAGEVVGVLPMVVGGVWIGPVWLRMGSVLGSESPFVQDLPVRGPWARAVLEAALSHLVTELRCDAVKFAPISDSEAQLAALREAARGLSGVGRVVRDAETGPYTVFELPETFDAYLSSSLDKRQRGNYRRAMKSLQESHEVVDDVLEDPAGLAAEFPRFVALHEAQWGAEGKLGHFGDWPGSRDYHADLVASHARHGRVHLARLLLDGETVSHQLCYSFGECLHWILPARVVRPDLDRYSLGRLGVVRMIEFAIRAGFRRIEAGVGHYDYKLQLGGTERSVRSFVFASNRTGARVRLRMFLRLARMLDKAYYRGWFLRAAPRLPLRRRPLWNTWIRSRL